MPQIERAPSQLVHRHFNFGTLAEKLEWEVLLAPETDPHLLGWIAGQKIRETLSGLELIFTETDSGMFWNGVNCSLATYTADVGGVGVNKYLTVSGANVCGETAVGGPTHAISLNAADATERVYAMLIGKFFVQAGAAPPGIGGASSSAALGKTHAVATTELYGGFNTRTTVTVGGVAHNLVTLSGLLVASP